MSKMTFLILTLLFAIPLGNAYANPNLSQLSRQTSFDLFEPQNLESGLSYEIKLPNNKDGSTSFDTVLLSYFGNNGKFKFALSQQKNNSVITQELTNINVQSKEIKKQYIKHKVRLEARGELVKINGSEGRYEAYVGKNATGGVLRWIQSGTYIELNAPELSKESLIKIAESMKKVN
ncbi:DUF4367 domain-containing protein [Cohnella lubricantis]|uniref:DUF4367 domain-containing protein n=1 Tax=Cohnella lubricantis TaxID=2163172 RepID=A0A841T7T3_9BACL|nr:DUF4367 domain-containing protein [Cohnella lubricantis]MBB6676116.1 DUF4367 domain-containing protein [Cohnella lubricantis]MBP2118689.1 hypothetical protein [Cohnella lubricantis]